MFKLTSDAIDEKGYFDPRYTCDVDNSSPELRWENPPEGTEGFAVVAETMDIAQNSFVLWLVYHIPREARHVPAGIPPQDALPNGIRQGLNGNGKLGWAGPCPPRNSEAQRYRIRLYALKKNPEPIFRAERAQLLEMIRDQIIDTAEITGRYQRMIERAG